MQELSKQIIEHLQNTQPDKSILTRGVIALYDNEEYEGIVKMFKDQLMKAPEKTKSLLTPTIIQQINEQNI